MSELSFFPKRMIHLDFHTGPLVPDVGRQFSAKAFAKTFKEAHVDSVTLFAKCHHGHLYYDTDHPARHPMLPRKMDLLADQIEALRGVGIRSPIYVSIQCDEYAANTHPEWIALTPELKHVKWGSNAFEAGWQIMDMSSPYQDYVAGQIDEVLRRFKPVDGLFLDMTWDQPSASKWAIDGMKKSSLDPRDAGDRNRYARQVAFDYMARFKKMVDDAQPKQPAGVWFNSRSKTNLHIEKKFLRHIEVESLPTGGWGYAYFPYVSRFVRPLGMPTLSHTGRFHKSWGDNAGLKPRAALMYECCQMLSQGITVGCGDLLHPRGAPSKAVYDLIGGVYGYIERCEPIVADAQLQSEIAVIVDPELGDNPGAAGLGAVRMLQQLRQQFDIVPQTAELKGYAVAIVPETTVIDAKLKVRLQAFVKAGGGLIVCERAAIGADGAPALPELGVVLHGPSPFTHTFLRPDADVAQGVPDFDTVVYERGLRMMAGTGAKPLVRVVEPYFERTYDHFSGHSYTPPDKVSRYAAVIQCGRVITFALPILEAFAKHGNEQYRQIFGNCLDRLLPKPLLRVEGPVHLETTVMGRGSGKTAQTIVHLISFIPSRTALEGLDLVNDPIPLVDMPIAVRADAAPKSVTLQPAGQDVAFSYKDGYVHTRVTVLEGHAMLVLSA
jgi:hypothetical protein